MAPTDSKLYAALREATKYIYKTDPDRLSVRRVRDKVVEDHDLDKDFFETGEWKLRSKEFIKKFADELMAGGDEEEEPVLTPVKSKAKPAPKKAAAPTPVKKGTKRAAVEEKARPAKRAKKAKTPSDDELSDVTASSEGSFSEESGAESSFGESESGSDQPKRKGKGKPVQKKKPVNKKPAKKGRKQVSSDEEESSALDTASEEEASGSDASPPKSKKKKVEPKSVNKAPAKKPLPKRTKKEDTPVQDESEDSTDSPKKKETPKRNAEVPADEEQDGSPNPSPVDKGDGDASEAKLSDLETSKSKLPPSKTATAANSDSEMSVVLDEPPPKKRKSKSTTATGSSKPVSKTAPKTKAATAELSPDEELLKTLQSQLKKCGVKKIFAFELKKFGDDTKAKIKHLQRELKDVGMVGRFSEARAREIKEQRELMADLEAVKEGEKAWGLETSKGRASRSKVRKNFKESDGSEEQESENGDDDDADEDEVPPQEKRRERARASLAFLDDEESD